MKSKLTLGFAASLVFVTGLFLMILGKTFLFGFMERISRISVFFAFLPVVMEASCAVDDFPGEDYLMEQKE